MGNLKRDHKLVLQKATFAVHAVPLVNGVEWVEERIIGNNLVGSFAQLRMIEQFVKGFYSQRIQHERGKIEWQGQWQPLFHRFGCQFPGFEC